MADGVLQLVRPRHSRASALPRATARMQCHRGSQAGRGIGRACITDYGAAKRWGQEGWLSGVTDRPARPRTARHGHVGYQ